MQHKKVLGKSEKGKSKEEGDRKQTNWGQVGPPVMNM